MAFNFDEFLADVLKNVPEDKKAGVEEALKLESVSGEIGKGYTRQADYSRGMDELTKAKTDAEAAVNQERGVLKSEKDRYASWYEDANKDYQAVSRENEAYRKEYGKLESFDPNAKHKVAPEPGLSQDQIAAEFERRDRAAIEFADALTDAKLDHNSRFDERLDTAKLFEHVEKSRLPFRAAYDDYIRPRVEEAQKAKFEEQLKQAKEEGVSEGRSQAAMPVQPDPLTPRAIDSLGQSTNQDDRVAAASAAFAAARVAGTVSP